MNALVAQGASVLDQVVDYGPLGSAAPADRALQQLQVGPQGVLHVHELPGVLPCVNENAAPVFAWHPPRLPHSAAAFPVPAVHQPFGPFRLVVHNRSIFFVRGKRGIRERPRRLAGSRTLSTLPLFSSLFCSRSSSESPPWHSDSAPLPGAMTASPRVISRSQPQRTQGGGTGEKPRCIQEPRSLPLSLV